MNDRLQISLVIIAAIVALAIFLAANIHFFMAAFQSQPACVAIQGAALPAKQSC